MRLLHAGLRDVPVRPLSRLQRRRPAKQSTMRWPAICAAAPATGRSSMPAHGSLRRRRPTIGSPGARAARLQALRSLDDKADSSSGTMAPFFAAPASEQSPGATLRATSRRDDRGRRHRRRPVGHQAARRRSTRSSMSAGSPSFLASKRRAERLCDRRGRLTGARRAGAGIDRSRLAEVLRAVRLDPGARLRHDRRQHRQRLADRRSRAGADGAGRTRGAAPRRAGARPCRWRASISTTASRTASRASSSPAVACRARRRARSFAPTRSPSASTRTSPRCCARFCLTVDGGRISEATGRLRRHGGDAQARAGRRSGAARAPACRNARLACASDAVGADFTAAHRHARQRRLPPARRRATWSSRRWPRLPVRNSDTTRIAGRRMIADAAG